MNDLRDSLITTLAAALSPFAAAAAGAQIRPAHFEAARSALRQWRAGCGPSPAQERDDAAVDSFAAAMKVKMAASRLKGRHGWSDPDDCSGAFLADPFAGHLGKDNPCNLEDLACLLMMLHQRGEDPGLAPEALARRGGATLELWARPGSRRDRTGVAAPAPR